MATEFLRFCARFVLAVEERMRRGTGLLGEGENASMTPLAEDPLHWLRSGVGRVLLRNMTVGVSPLACCSMLDNWS